MSAAPVRVVIHPDFLRLEDELVTALRTLKPDEAGAFLPVLVVAPSQRQVNRLREMLASRCGALLGVEVLHHQALAHRLARSGRAPVPALASRPLLERLMHRILRDEPGLEISPYAIDRPGALSAVVALMGELREAGFRHEDLETARAPGEIGRLLARYEDALRRLETREEQGWTDRAGLARLAVEAAGATQPFEAVFHHGAYELVGMNLDLIRAVPTRRETTFLIPADPTAPSWKYAREFVKRHLGVEPAVLDDGKGGARAYVAAARTLRRRESASRGAPPPLTLLDAQGPEAELNLVARLCLERIRAGADPDRLGILARSLDAYAPLAEIVFERHGLPVDTPVGLPLARHPKAHGFLLLVRALAADFERQTVIDLLRSPALQRPENATEESSGWPADVWDRWSRVYRIVRGVEAWTGTLPRALEGESPSKRQREDPDALREYEKARAWKRAAAKKLAGLVTGWEEERERWRRCRTAVEHAEFLRGLGGRWIRRWDAVSPAQTPRDQKQEEDVNRLLTGILDELEALDAVDAALARSGSETPPPGPEEILNAVETAMEQARIGWSDPDGVRFLDVMQARGLTFDHVYLIGCNTGLLPRQPRENVFLPDAVRKRLRQTTGRPIAVSGEGRMEERLLFAQTVAAALESLTMTRQRADAEGRAMGASLEIRELTRSFPPPSPTLDLFETEKKPEPRTESVPAHPAEAAAWFARNLGLLSLEEAAVLVCDRASGPARNALAGFLAAVESPLGPGLESGLTLVETVEQFEGDALTYDGHLPGGTGWSRPFSAYALQRMGRCPQTFFFRDVLGVRPLEDPAEELSFGPFEIGTVMHELLETILNELGRTGALETGDETSVVRAGLEALDRHWQDALRLATRRMWERFPGLWESVESAWLDELTAFLKQDLTRLVREGHRQVEIEPHWSVTLTPEQGLALAAAANLGPRVEKNLAAGEDASPGIAFSVRPDRVTRNGEGQVRVSDYKTRGILERRIEEREMLRGREIQIPLYALLAEQMEGRPAEVELLGLGPAYLPDGGFVRAGATPLPPDRFAKLRASFEETLLALAVLVREGRFPFQQSRGCRFCPFRPACRRHHAPSASRVKTHPAYGLYQAVQDKEKRKPSLTQTGYRDEETR